MRWADRRCSHPLWGHLYHGVDNPLFVRGCGWQYDPTNGVCNACRDAVVLLWSSRHYIWNYVYFDGLESRAQLDPGVDVYRVGGHAARWCGATHPMDVYIPTLDNSWLMDLRYPGGWHCHSGAMHHACVSMSSAAEHGSTSSEKNMSTQACDHGTRG
jgi:hypothetical protein